MNLSPEYSEGPVEFAESDTRTKPEVTLRLPSETLGYKITSPKKPLKVYYS